MFGSALHGQHRLKIHTLNKSDSQRARVTKIAEESQGNGVEDIILNKEINDIRDWTDLRFGNTEHSGKACFNSLQRIKSINYNYPFISTTSSFYKWKNWTEQVSLLIYGHIQNMRKTERVSTSYPISCIHNLRQG